MAIDFLTTQSTRLNQLVSEASVKFSAIGAEQWAHKPDPGKWSKKEILGHLIDSAANNHLRFVRAQLQDKEYSSFGYEQDFFVSSQHYQEKSIEDNQTLWEAYNKHLAHVILHINPEKLQIVCRIGQYEPCDLAFIVKDYVDHLEHHLVEICTA